MASPPARPPRSTLTRRLLLEHGASLAALSLTGLTACGDDTGGDGSGGGGPGAEPESPLFVHGVASGDPLPDAVVLWTRVTTDAASVEVTWRVATDPALDDEVASGTFTTDAGRDFTVKVDATGLEPGTTYYYRFEVGDERSAIGRTRTAPAGPIERLRIAVVSCSSYAHGWFHVYGALSEQPDLDLVVHLGDYVYEYADGDYGDVRTYDPPHETVTLDDYRRRYAHYRRDAQLKAAHRQHPFVVVWDDHESANNANPEGAENHDPATEGAWADRKAAAARAHAEWMPIREQDDPLRIWRTLRFGDLVDLVLLDTRLWGRSPQAPDNQDPSIDDESRTLLGDDQEAWLAEQLRTTTARWSVIGQQVMMGHLPQFLNVDAWDGYPAARQRFFDVVENEATGDVVVLTGDIHSSWAMDLPRDPDVGYDPATGAGSLAVELVVPAVTSPGLGLAIGDALEVENPWMKLVDTDRRGYVVLDVTHERLQAAYVLYDAIDVEDGAVATTAGVVATYAGAPHLVLEAAAAAAPQDAPALAP